MTTYYEIITDGNSRPEHPEDNTLIVPAITIYEALEKFKTLRSAGETVCTGYPKSCKQIFYVMDI